MGWWERYRRFLQLSVAVILIITAISFINRGKEHYILPERLLGIVLSPVQGAVQGISNYLTGTIEGIVELRNLRDENRRLREELEKRDYMYSLLAELRAENARLLKLVNLREMMPEFETIAARVIAREPSNWYNAITINVGSQQGIEVDMPVITHRGLVGRVMSVDGNRAQVLLLLDQRSSVGGMIQKSREPGIVKGFAGEKENLRLLYLPRDAKIQAGDRVITSGLGGVFPKGLIIGSVIEVKAEEYGLSQYAVVRAAADFHHLEEVLVIVAAADGGEGE